MTEAHDAAATRIVRALTGGRWTWPPVQARELYPAPTGRIILRGRPVRTVVSVSDYDSGADLAYTQFANGVIELSSYNPIMRCAPHGRRVDVTYEYGSKPSPLIQAAIATLSSELASAEADTAECRLPERVTSVNRQGVSWTVIDPQEFLEQGRTGIYEIDLAIKAVGSSKARARVFSPEFPPPERIETTILPDPEATP